MSRLSRAVRTPARIVRRLALIVRSPCACALALVAVPATTLAAQGIRIAGVTTVQLVELRPLVVDSFPSTDAIGTGEWRTTADGVPALCPATSAFCTAERSGSRVSAAPVLQDLAVAGWGIAQGLSFHADLRVRAQLGTRDAFIFPRANDHFDALDAYAELERSSWRARLGRQWSTGPLGAYAFDGGEALWHRDAISLEGWAGRALLAGLSDPYTSGQLAAVDNLPPQQDGYLFGGRARLRPDALSAASLTYQRVLTADRSGLYSERANLAASSRALPASLELGLNYDFATGAFDEAGLRVGTQWQRTVNLSAELRHSRPYFELWTIWGAFSPVGFDEERLTADVMPLGAPLMLALRGAYRKYAETNAGLSLRTSGWRAGGDLRWQGVGGFSALGSYDVDIGSGAASTDVRASLRWLSTLGAAIGATASITQNIYEFRVGTGRIHGLALDATLPLAPDVGIALDGAVYRHALSNGAPGPDWTQRRASVRVEWTVGRDPGMPTGAR